jgi:hypothetical protein
MRTDPMKNIAWSIALAALLALGSFSPLLAQQGASKVVGLGEACDPNARIECSSGLECNASKPDVAGVCVSSASRTMVGEELGADVPPRKPAAAQ